MQRVASASVSVRGEIVASIGRGLLALVGVADGDGHENADWMAEKTANIRIFEDEAGKMNLSVLDVRGEVLAVSQFTLLADARKGRRPSFAGAAAPEHAQTIYRDYQKSLARRGCPVSEGVFQEHMAVSLVNDGPVTIILDTCEQPGQRNSTR